MGYNTDFKGELFFACDMANQDFVFLQSFLDKAFEFMDEKGKLVEGWVDLELTPRKTGLRWNGNDKTYHMVEAINHLTEKMKSYKFDFKLSGELLAQGEDIEDRWRVRMVDGVATRVADNDNERKRDILHEVIAGLRKHRITVRQKTRLGSFVSATGEVERKILDEAKRQIAWEVAKEIHQKLDYITQIPSREPCGGDELEGSLYAFTHNQLLKLLQEIADNEQE